ncbi:hypothetical protein IRP63_09935 [Clostridium botulinum]|uniref:Uncharacterized protein n=1 Tax=Clostridium botulinum C/D str. DC5 TaxID=1443128 RepID=A0A0A0II69_CLOBO|nr:DUF6762 family protein [Clostridium botulinum]KEI03199.1 hypothetical protein Z952_08525 [Clostridium botulinum C/D str. BKT75002]KEI07574.1 hypothetical protein Z954_03725 [Clostridium botulinum C/D str. BKT2873]KGM93787.1 hypothetical protein Z956_10725 [Clostridium botulinum D str. CCUG 7971]KGM99956.1 hypothetical protein Z955_05105 [Clostridium botulinum C/D str. DC5]KOC49728.1 hypothetical protein ADU88_04545 [Clostridium botulinum]
MDFAALVLMEVDENNKFIKEMGSYEVHEGAEYISKFYYNKDSEKVSIYFDTHKDVEEWEYTAIYELFDLGVFEDKGYEIDEKDDEYNPTWILKFNYIEEHSDMAQKLGKVCELIKAEIEKVFEKAEKNKEEYI